MTTDQMLAASVLAVAVAQCAGTISDWIRYRKVMRRLNILATLYASLGCNVAVRLDQDGHEVARHVGARLAARSSLGKAH